MVVNSGWIVRISLMMGKSSILGKKKKFKVEVLV